MSERLLRWCSTRERITVYDVLECLASGMTEDESLADVPDLEREDIRASLAIAADRERRFVSSRAVSLAESGTCLRVRDVAIKARGCVAGDIGSASRQ